MAPNCNDLVGILVLAFFLAPAILLGPGATLVSATGGGGPCTPYERAITIAVNSVDDIYKRLNHPPTTTVELVLQKDLKLPTTLTFSDLFSCTIFTSKSTPPLALLMPDDTTGPVLAITNASNLLIQNLDFRLPLKTHTSPCKAALPMSGGPIPCPAISVYRSWGVQIAQSRNTQGRIDVLASTQVSLDSLTITALPTDRAAVDFAGVGDGPNRVTAQVSLTNCNVTGGFAGALLGRGAVGVVVANNVFRNQRFAGVQCGSGARNVGDCMLSQIRDNYITVDAGFPTTDDAAAVYFASHWVNPGNTLTCNYAVGGLQCMYLDWASSGVTVDGMVCAHTVSGLKLNTGHSNRVSSLLIVDNNLPGWISCQNYELNNCLHPSGKSWDQGRLESFNSPSFQKDYPWLNNFCKLTSFKGQSCNPAGSAPASKTGACSGIPTGNEVEIVIVDPRKPKNTPTFLSCDAVGVVRTLNSVNYTSPPLSSGSIGFRDFEGADFGLLPTSPVYKLYPKFRSCPKSANGIQEVAKDAYLSQYNVQPGPLVKDL